MRRNASLISRQLIDGLIYLPIWTGIRIDKKKKTGERKLSGDVDHIVARQNRSRPWEGLLS
jgi:hypothetical protein